MALPPALDRAVTITTTPWAFMVGDTWRFRQNLSINLGMRWEYIGAVTERDGLVLLPKDTSLAALNDPNVMFDFAGGPGQQVVRSSRKT